MAGNSKYFIYDMADFESSRGCTSKFSNFFGSIEFYAYRRAYFEDCGSVQKLVARLLYIRHAQKRYHVLRFLATRYKMMYDAPRMQPYPKNLKILLCIRMRTMYILPPFLRHKLTSR